ncbi:MAG: hypothetical protein AB1608_04850 [Thermoproteota archaeon]
MSESSDIVDYIKELRMVLADSIDLLLNLQFEGIYDQDDEIIPVNSSAELVDMSYDVAHSIKLKIAESEFLKRQTH